MRIQILSDLHFEFHDDVGLQFATEYLRPEASDMLILAGDLGTTLTVEQALATLIEKYGDKPLIFVPGNHDFYGTSISRGVERFRKLAKKYKNVHFLYNDAVTINDITFVGTTLWFPKQPGYTHYAARLSDFAVITNFDDEVFLENDKAKEFLDWHVTDKTVVVTHHVPLMKSIPDKYKEDQVNMFFVCNMEEFMLKHSPMLWVHGHTHSSFNYVHEKTHVVCNPLGYIGHEINPEFIPNLIVEV
jgi:predicted phosphodiesterase